MAALPASMPALEGPANLPQSGPTESAADHPRGTWYSFGQLACDQPCTYARGASSNSWCCCLGRRACKFGGVHARIHSRVHVACAAYRERQNERSRVLRGLLVVALSRGVGHALRAGSHNRHGPGQMIGSVCQMAGQHGLPALAELRPDARGLAFEAVDYAFYSGSYAIRGCLIAGERGFDDIGNERAADVIPEGAADGGLGLRCGRGLGNRISELVYSGSGRGRGGSGNRISELVHSGVGHVIALWM
jgi:hypothetical protein